MTFAHDLKASVRTIPDYPKKGILFRDITPLLANGPVFATFIDELASHYRGRIDAVAGLDADKKNYEPLEDDIEPLRT